MNHSKDLARLDRDIAALKRAAAAFTPKRAALQAAVALGDTGRPFVCATPVERDGQVGVRLHGHEAIGDVLNLVVTRLLGGGFVESQRVRDMTPEEEARLQPDWHRVPSPSEWGPLVLPPPATSPARKP